MPEVKEIGAGETPPRDVDHAFVRPVPSGRFLVDTHVIEGHYGKFWGPPAFGTIEEAISAALVWADANEISIIYVRRSVE